MAEEVRRPTASAPPNEPGGKGTATGFELRLERGGAFVQLADQPIAPGVRLEALSLAVPDLTFPFPVGAGSGQFRTRLCDLARFAVVAEPALLEAGVAKLDLGSLGLAALEAGFRDGFAELAGRIAGGPAFTLAAGLVPEGDAGLAVVFHSPRVYGPGPVAAAALPHVAAGALAGVGLPPEPLAPLLRRTLAPRGWKIPRAGAVRLVAAELAASGARLVWARDGSAAEPAERDPALLAAIEGARTFRDGEARLASGDLAGARDAYLAAGPAALAHPFAAERLLSLLLLEERFHDEALDLAADWLARRPDFAPALLAEASVRTARGEDDRASRALAALAAGAASRGERSSALAAAEACFALPGADRAAALAAVETALGLRRDHLGALRALRALASAGGDREALLRADRRLVAYSPDDAEKARAHAELADLLQQADPPAARLHLDQALRLAPEDPDALAALARACEAAGEPLRAVRTRDRLRALLLARGDRAGAAREALEAGALWEERLGHDENALLRYRDAAELTPAAGADVHARAARAAERLGRWADAADHHAAVLQALDPTAPDAAALAARTHLALADVAERRLADPAAAAQHLAAALQGAAPDAAALRRLAALWRTLDRPAELLSALDRLAPLVAAAERAALLAETGALAAERLGQPEAARSRLAAALALDERCRPALEGLARLAAERGDAAAERDAILKLLPLVAGADDRAALHDRLADACERAGDLAAAVRAAAEARRTQPSLARLAHSVRLARLAGDGEGVAALLAEQASAAGAAGDAAVAAGAWLERARLLAPTDRPAALTAIAEARALAPGDPEVLRLEAELAEASGDARRALGCLRALLAAGAPDAAALEVRAARAALAAGEPVAARAHAERAALDPAAAGEILASLADLRLADGDRAGASAALLALARLRGGADGAALALRAHAAAASVEALDVALSLDPALAPARVERARLRDDGGDPAGALADAEAALASDALAPGARAELERLAARAAAALGADAPARAHLAAYAAARPGDRAALDDALAAARGAADRPDAADGAIELWAALASAAGAHAEAAAALLARAHRGADADAPDAADRLVEAALAALEAGVPGARAALERGLARGVDRDVARSGFTALAADAARAGDDAAERAALAALVPLLTTSARPERVRRLARLALAAGDLATARAAAEEGRALAPRDAGAVALARDVARAQGDEAAVAERLAELAALQPEGAGALLLERARVLARLGEAAAADEAFADALRALPPELALAREHARLRREALPARGVAEPLERCALRLPDPRDAAGALREAAAVAVAAGERGPALRCARRAYARTRDDVAFAGPLLARILYLEGARGEALVLHRKLGEVFPELPPDDVVVLARQLAELAEDAGEQDLALAALDVLLARKPQDADAALRRFRLEPDRARAVRRLDAIAEHPASARTRAALRAAAAEGALRDLRDAALAERLWLEARADAARDPAHLAALERARAAALRDVLGAGAPDALAALHDAAAAAQACADGAGERALLEEAVAAQRAAGLLGEAAQDLLQLDALAAADGDFARAAAHAREAGALLRQAGDLAGAADALRRSTASDPANDETWQLLEEVATALGDGSPLLAEVLEQEVARARPGATRAAARVRLAAALARGSDREGAIAALEAALAEHPDDARAETALEGLLLEAGRPLDRARRMLARAARMPDGAERTAVRREAAAILGAAPAAADRALAAEAWAEVARAAPADLAAARAAADLLLAAGRGDDAAPHLAALVRADPDDDEAARQLADVWADRPRDRADLLLERAARARGARRSERLREAATALLAAGEDARAKDLLRDAFDAWPADDAAFFAAIRDAATDAERLDAVLAARARAVPAEAAGCHRARADALLAFGRTERALDAYRACVAAAPEDPEPAAMLAAALAQTQGDAAAAAEDGRVVALAEARAGAVPGAFEAPSRYRLGLAAWAEGRPADGILHLERALLLAPEDARAGVAWAALAHGHAARGDAPAALAAARARADRAGALGLDEERRNALEAAAELAAEHGDAGPDAAAILWACAELRGAEDPALLARAEAALRSAGEAARAEALRARVLGIPPAAVIAPPPPAAGAAEEDAVLARAIEAGPEAPGFDATLDDLVVRRAARGDHRGVAALEALRAASAADPARRAVGWLASAEALARGGADPDEVRTALELATDADPDLPEPWAARAALDARRGDRVSAARAWLSVSIRSEGDTAAHAALEAARLFQEEGRHADAARAYRAAVAARPGCVPARRVLAEEALAAGDGAAAADHLAAIPIDALPVEARPEHQRALARALEAAGRPDDAERVWSDAFAVDPADAEAFAHLGARALARGGLDAWLALAAQHDAALAAAGDVERRRDLRCARGLLLAERGRLEEARGALLAALELDPAHAASHEALAALDARAEDWARVAAELAAEADGAADRAEAAALLLRAARIQRDRLGRSADAVATLQEARVRARLSEAPAAQRVATEADALLAELAAEGAAGHADAGAGAGGGGGELVVPEEWERGEPEPSVTEGGAGSTSDSNPTSDLTFDSSPSPSESPSASASAAGERDSLEADPGSRIAEEAFAASMAPEPPAAPAEPPTLDSLDAIPLDLDLDLPPASDPDPLASILRSEAAASDGAGRADALERLAVHLEQKGDHAGAAEARAEAARGAEPDAIAAARAAVDASGGASPAEQVRARRALADALEARGDVDGAIGALLGAQQVAPDDVGVLEALARLTEAAGRPGDALAWSERVAELGPEAERARRLGALAARAEALGERDRAQWLWERARAADPRDAAALAALARHYAEAGELGALRSVAEPLAAVSGQAALEPFAAPLGRAHLESGALDDARRWLERAYATDPADLTLARDLSRVAEKLGDFEAYVRHGAVCAEAIGGYDPLAASAKYRHFAEVADAKLGDRPHAAAFLERAVALSPDDAEARAALLALLSSVPGGGADALERALEAARESPADPTPLSEVAALCAALASGAAGADAARLRERARLAASLAAFATRDAPPAAPRVPAQLPESVRDRAAVPGAMGPLARLLRLLAPWLEPLFPAELARRGATSEDRLTAARAPALHAALDGASRAMRARAHVVFALDRPALELAIENTRPPAIVLAVPRELPEPGAAFVAARALALLESGWALAGKFAPRDVGILLQLACRFADGSPPDLGLPKDRAEAFLEALGRAVPEAVRERAAALGAEAAAELAATDPRSVVAALRRSANRIGLLYAGDPCAALTVLARLDRRLSGPVPSPGAAPSPIDPAQALAAADLRDLALFALSDPFLELRAAALEDA